MNTPSQIENLVQQRLLGKKIDIVEVVDQLLDLVVNVGELRCSMASDDRLRFEIRDHPPFEVGLDIARSKLRTMCARLAVLCNETGGQDVSFYGGEGVIAKVLATVPEGALVMQQSWQAPSPPDGVPLQRSDTQMTWKVRFKNTPSEQEFTIQSQ